MTPRIWLAEFIGTFALMFAGIAALAAGASSLAVALAFGLSVAAMIAAVGALSFAHFNPAVTVGFWVLRRITFRELLLYWSAELTGAVCALFTLRIAYGPTTLESVAYGATLLAPNVTILQALTTELILSFFLMFVIATCVIQKAGAGGALYRFYRDAGGAGGGCAHGRVDESRSQFCTGPVWW